MIVDISRKKNNLEEKIKNQLCGWMRYFDKTYLSEIIDYLVDNYSEKPMSLTTKLEDIFEPFNKCSAWDLKVIILADEPTSNKEAYPIPFGQKFIERDKINPSLKLLQKSADLIRSETMFDTNGRIDPTLNDWLKQGVLVANSSPTVLWDNPGSHADLWYPLMRSFLRNISTELSNIVYVLLGENAHRLDKHIQKKKGNVIIKDYPPKYYIEKNMDHTYSFFKFIDKYMEIKFKEVIFWNERIDKTVSNRMVLMKERIYDK